MASVANGNGGGRVTHRMSHRVTVRANESRGKIEPSLGAQSSRKRANSLTTSPRIQRKTAKIDFSATKNATMWSCVVEFQEQINGKVHKPVRQENARTVPKLDI